MDPFFCVDKQALKDQGIMRLTDAQIKGPELCFLVKPTKFKPIFFYPMSMSQYIGSDLIAVQCECPRDQLNSGCNDRNSLFNLFYDMDRNDMTKPIQFALNLQKYLLDDPVNGDLKMQQVVQPVAGGMWDICPMDGAAFANVSYITGSNVTGNEYLAAGWTEVCPWGSCASFLFSSNQDEAGQTFLPLNQHLYQARNAPWLNNTYVSSSGSIRRREMCENTVYNAAMMDAFIASPPTLLVEPYFECVPTNR